MGLVHLLSSEQGRKVTMRRSLEKKREEAWVASQERASSRGKEELGGLCPLVFGSAAQVYGAGAVSWCRKESELSGQKNHHINAKKGLVI